MTDPDRNLRMVKRLTMTMQLAEQGAQLHPQETLQIDGMILGIRHLKFWHQRKDLEIQDCRFEEDGCFFQWSQHLMTQSSVVEYDDDDQSILLVTLKTHLFDQNLCFLKKDECSVPFLPIHVQETVFVKFKQDDRHFIWRWGAYWFRGPALCWRSFQRSHHYLVWWSWSDPDPSRQRPSVGCWEMILWGKWSGLHEQGSFILLSFSLRHQTRRVFVLRHDFKFMI